MPPSFPSQVKAMHAYIDWSGEYDHSTVIKAY